MKIGILSDTHDDIDNVKEAIYRFKEQKVELIIHAGDFVFPGIVDDESLFISYLPTIQQI